MNRMLLIGLSLALSASGWLTIRDYTWIPADAPRWNPFAIKESGFGRTVARILTEQANTSYHHGLFEQSQPQVVNPLSRWLDAGTASLGFPGRLKYRPVEQYPVRPCEVKQAVEQAEKNLRLAFELDPGNYAAYDVYLFFLTNDLTQTDQANAQEPPSALREWAEQERERRHKRAIEITDEAIRKFRPNTEDPERYLTAAVMWYNRFLLLAPEVAERRKSAEARKKFEEAGLPALNKMKYYLQAARACQHDLEKKGLWQTIPERRKEFLQVAQLLEKSADALAVALQVNRSQMNQDRLSSTFWSPPGQN
jgi:tetratricopeptide (TPR) repeat protein